MIHFRVRIVSNGSNGSNVAKSVYSKQKSSKTFYSKNKIIIEITQLLQTYIAQKSIDINS